MMFKKKKEHKIVINNIIRPIKLNDNEKLVLVVGNDEEVVPQDAWERIVDEMKEIGGAKSIAIPNIAIKAYIVEQDKIELYRGDISNVKKRKNSPRSE